MTFVARILILELLLVAALTWMLERSFTPTIPVDFAVEQALAALDLDETNLRSNILAARAGLLQNYDPLVADARAMRRDSGALRASAEGSGERGRALAAAVDAKEDALEQFKSENAILRNALATFDLLSARLTRARIDPNLALAVGSLASAITHLSRDPSPEVARSATFWVDALSDLKFPPGQADDAASLSRHGRLLLDLLPRVDLLIKRQDTLSFAPETQAIATDLRHEREYQRKVSSWFHWALYGTALAVSALLLRAGLGLRSRTAALQARVELETAIVKVSNLFVACPPEEIDEWLDAALGLFGTALGADRTYMVRRDFQRIRLWTRPGISAPTDWPQSRHGLPAVIDRTPRRKFCGRTDDVELFGGLSHILRREGMVGICFTAFQRDDVPAGILVFERSTPFADEGMQTEVSLELIAEVMAGAISRRDADRRRRDLERKLRRAERLQILGSFASGIAHNFNNVLGVIIGQAEMAAAAPDAGALAARHVREIAEAGQHAREIAGKILEFGRGDQRAPKVIEIAGAVTDAVRQVEAATPRRAAVIVTGGIDAGHVLADPTQITQVLVNVVQNAVQASGDQVPVAVRLDRIASRGERLSHGVVEAGSFLRVTVSDTGRGMAGHELARMFEPFFTTRDCGTGLGLATARDTVVEMGGAFDVRSTPGAGTNVAIWLPEAAAAPRNDAKGGVVLLLGGDRTSVERDEELLAAIGYEPVGFTEPELALRALHKGNDRFDFAIVDQAVVGAGKTTVLQALRAALPMRQPILLSVPEGDDNPTPNAVPGVAAVLMRPWRSGHIAATIARTVSGG